MLWAADEPSAKAIDGGMPFGQSSACSTVPCVWAGLNWSMTAFTAAVEHSESSIASRIRMMALQVHIHAVQTGIRLHCRDSGRSIGTAIAALATEAHHERVRTAHRRRHSVRAGSRGNI